MSYTLVRLDRSQLRAAELTLGYSRSSPGSYPIEDYLSLWTDEYCTERCRYTYLEGGIAFHFSKGSDALLFKLTWA